MFIDIPGKIPVLWTKKALLLTNIPEEFPSRNYHDLLWYIPCHSGVPERRNTGTARIRKTGSTG